ncbi:MAG: hypothetical protein JRJ27_12260 [Deltaproteobacteria bacterium]|nr:hypothetical protein [Deltaproteobacteria bacterium]
MIIQRANKLITSSFFLLSPVSVFINGESVFFRTSFYILIFLACFAIFAVKPLHAGEKFTIQPSGVVSWDYMVKNPKEMRALPEKQKAVPDKAVPEPVEIGGGTIRSAATSDTEAVIAVEAADLLPATLGSSGPLDVTRRFRALDDDNTVNPPCPTGAAGPNHLMSMLNSQVRIESKRGTNISTVSLNTFWTSGTSLSGNPFDPRLVYDSLSNRWIAVVCANAWSSSSTMWFAVSDDSDPTGNWTYYGFDADSGNADWADLPDIGVNNTWVAITATMYIIADGNISGAKMWVMNKSTLGGSLTFTEFSTGFDSAAGWTGVTLRPCVTFDSAQSTLYIVDFRGLESSGTYILRLSRITGSASSPSWSAVPGSSILSGSGFFFVNNNFNYTQIDAAQPGTATDIETNYPFIINAVLRNGSVWCTHNAGLPVSPSASTRTAVFWYELNPASSASPIVQSGVVDGGTGVHHFSPSITANINDDVLLGFTRSDSSRYAEAVVTGRENTDTAGTMGSITVIKSGEDSFVKDFGTGRVRWGDYSATVVDPADDATFWTIQEYAETDVGSEQYDDRWGTWWAQVGGEPIPTVVPVLMFLLGD